MGINKCVNNIVYTLFITYEKCTYPEIKLKDLRLTSAYYIKLPIRSFTCEKYSEF